MSNGTPDACCPTCAVEVLSFTRDYGDTRDGDVLMLGCGHTVGPGEGEAIGRLVRSVRALAHAGSAR